MYVYLYVCVYMCKCVHTYVCIYVLICMCTHANMLLQMILDIHSSTGASEVIPAEVTDLVGYIWNEANGELNDVLSVPVEGIKLEQVGES